MRHDKIGKGPIEPLPLDDCKSGKGDGIFSIATEAEGRRSRFEDKRRRKRKRSPVSAATADLFLHLLETVAAPACGIDGRAKFPAARAKKPGAAVLLARSA